MQIRPIILLALPLCLSADVFTSSVSCSAPTGVYGSGTYIAQSRTGTSSTGCTVDGFLTGLPPGSVYLAPPQHANAGANGSYSLSANGISGTIVAYAAAYPISTATAQIEFQDRLTTAGPVRDGVIRGYFFTDNSHYGGGGGTSLLSPTLPYATFGPAAPPISFTLGQPFTIDIFSHAYSSSDDGTSSYLQATGYFSLNFFEADGVTPVAFSEIPEPSTYSLVGLSFAGAALLRKKLA